MKIEPQNLDSYECQILRWRNRLILKSAVNRKICENINENTGIAQKYCGIIIKKTLTNRFTQFFEGDDAKTMANFFDKNYFFPSHKILFSYSIDWELVRMEENERTATWWLTYETVVETIESVHRLTRLFQLNEWRVRQFWFAYNEQRFGA